MERCFWFTIVCGLALSNIASGQTFVDDWVVEVHCDGICLDLNWDDIVNEEDFLLVVACCGREANLIGDGQSSLQCVEAAFSRNGYVDVYDIYAWDWALKEASRADGPACLMPLESSEAVGWQYEDPNGPTPIVFEAVDPNVVPGDLLVLGKGRMTSAYDFGRILEDGFYSFDSDPAFLVDLTGLGLPNRCNVRFVRGPQDGLFLVNTEYGVLRVSESTEAIVPPMQLSCASDPRWQGSATVSIGVQGTGYGSFGRPVLDVGFDNEGGVYVAPVVVKPDAQEPYVTAAKLHRIDANESSYELVQLYDNPPGVNDSQYRDGLREIEVDQAGYVYLVNAHALNESCILWQYDPNGTVLQRLDLLTPASPVHIADPLAIHLSLDGRILYLASGQCNWEAPQESIIHVISTSDLSPMGQITIQNMRQITGITEDPATGELWITGFNMPEIPQFPNACDDPFYSPALARVPPGTDAAWAIGIADPELNDLALPTSVVWMGQE